MENTTLWSHLTLSSINEIQVVNSSSLEPDKM